MKRALHITILLTLFPLAVSAVPDAAFFHADSQVRSAGSVAESQQLFDARTQAALSWWARQDMPEWEGWVKTGFLRSDPGGTAKVSLHNIGLAKLALRNDIDRVNQVVQDGDAYSGVGSQFQIIRGLQRKGDYDFALLGLTAIAYEFWNDSRLSTTTQHHLATELLNQEGRSSSPSRIFGIIPETENHILMTESSRYLKNQLVAEYSNKYAIHDLPDEKYDNDKNGLNEWMVAHLSQFLKEGFDEYNSKPYETFTINAVQNLYEYANDGQVKMAAQNVLDFHALRFALQSMDLRRVVPFRRQKKHAGLKHTYARDGAVARYGLLVGNYHAFGESEDDTPFLEHHAWTVPAVGSYRVPDLVADLMIDKSHNPYFYRSFFDNVEIVHAEEEFLISAGGIYHDKYKLPFLSHHDGVVRPTTVLLSGGSARIPEMIRFEGRKDTVRKNNTCVYTYFACGINPQLPQQLQKRAEVGGVYRVEGDWAFLQVGDAYVAFYQHEKSDAPYATRVGFLEIRSDDTFPTLGAFKQAVLEHNATPFSHFGENTYTMTDGTEITFEMAKKPSSHRLLGFLFDTRVPDTDLSTWQIKKIVHTDDSVDIPTHFSDWPLVDARSTIDGTTIAYADGSGKVLVNNPYLRRSLMLDSSGDTAQRMYARELVTRSALFHG